MSHRGSPLGWTAAAAALVGTGWALDARRREKKRSDIHRILVDLLLNALTADDPITGRHSRRVADLSYALACGLELHPSEVATLRVSALFHDMGKIDDRFWHIVHSRESLTPEQRCIMEGHAQESARIVEPLEPIHPGIRAIVASHHEHWDGSGYPHELSGKRIPLGSRIIALADAFDAMTQPRRYREPMDPDDAFRKLREGAGCQFDPVLTLRVVEGPVRRSWLKTALEGRRDEKESAAGKQAHAQPSGAERDERFGAGHSVRKAE